MVSIIRNFVTNFRAKLLACYEYVFNHSYGVKKIEPIYKCFFLTNEGIRGLNNTTEDLLNMLHPIAEFFNEAKESLDLCFYLITDYTIVDSIIKAKKRNVKVRLITDFSSGIVNNKFAKNFYKEGISVYTKKLNPGQTIMHNKYCIRDGNMVLQASMNLTKNTSKGSFDNVMITNDPDLVAAFKTNFEELIVEFSSD